MDSRLRPTAELPPPVLAIGNDAAEIELVDRLVAAGKLPNIAQLRAAGAQAVLTHRHGGLQSSVWRSFTTGGLVTSHGCYFPKAWRAERMRVEFINDAWPPVSPFWAHPSPRPLRTALIDVPYLSDPGPGFDGVFLSGWQCHDVMPRRSRPSSLLGDITGRFGSSRLSDEHYGPQTPETLERTHRDCVAATGQIADICAWLMERDRYDLFVVVLGSAHRAGHYLWDLSQIDAAALAPDRRARLEAALEETYIACDAAVGRIEAAAPENARRLLFAMHGMGPNLAWYEKLQPLFELASGAGPSSGAPRGIWGLVGGVLGSAPAKAVTSRVPRRLQHLLTPLWTKRMHDWSTTTTFTVPSDLNGYIRVNQAGREPMGIVPASEARALLEQLAAGFLAIEDVDTGQPICLEAELIDDIAGPNAPMRACLPDLVVRWADRPLRESRGARNRRGDERRWPRVTRYGSGRAGNHRPNGWMIVTGPGIPRGASLGPTHAIDIVPTLCHWLGIKAPPGVDGRSIEALASGAAPPDRVQDQRPRQIE